MKVLRLKRKPKLLLLTIGFLVVISVLFACTYGNDAKIRGEKNSDEKGPMAQADYPEIQIPENCYNNEKFYSFGGSDVRFYADNHYRGVAGVDVSHYQSEIVWEEVKASGVEFAIIQAAYRGWGDSGEIVTGPAFKEQIEGALNAGLDVGVYFFSQALNEEEAIEEAEYTLALIEEYDITYPVVFDWEIPNEEARTNDMNMLILTSCADAFCRTVKEAGYEPCVYFNKDFGYEQYNLESLKEYTFWLAEYAEFPSFAYKFDMWQYTEKGTVPGIVGEVDLNIMFESQ